MSRCSNDYTNGFVMMNKREQRAFTLALVWLALKPDLTMSERRTLETFEKVWLAGKDFTLGRSFDFFLALCKRKQVPIRFMKKPADTGRRGEKGAMVEIDWTVPDPNGSYWPAVKNGEGERRSNEELIQMKADYRRGIMLKEMARLGVSELSYKYNIDDRIERVVDERLRERDSEPEQVQPEPTSTPTSTESVPRPNPFDRLDYGFDYNTIH
jgi:hypothetical protein